MASNRKQRQTDRKEITLMTILANEATADSRKLLKKYNRPDAKSHSDLEQKLAQLYFDTTDKVQLEKEMAAIHPHRKWIEKYIEPKVEITETIEETKSNVDGGCNCEYCREQRRAINRASCPCALNRNWEQKSNVDGITETKPQRINVTEIVLPIALVGIITIGFVAIMKLNK